MTDNQPAVPRELAPDEEYQHISDDALNARCGVSLVADRNPPLCPDCLAIPDPGFFARWRLTVRIIARDIFQLPT